MRPSSSQRFACCTGGSQRVHMASMNSAPVLLAASTPSAASARVAAKGFSLSTALPCSIA